jgi:hypothetical protein
MRRLASISAVLAVVSIASVARAEPHLRCREDSCWGPSSTKDAKAAIATAEAELARGNSKRAAYAIGEMFTDVDDVDLELDLVAAVGALRSGITSIRSQNPAKTIRLAYEAKPDDARRQALYAESLLRGQFSGALATPAARAKREAEALRLLTSLQTRKLLLTAHGWAALARAHHLAGATAAAEKANARCASMAVNPAVCTWSTISVR